MTDLHDQLIDRLGEDRYRLMHDGMADFLGVENSPEFVDRFLADELGVDIGGAP